ncbi:unnamed protein product [Schistosoma margrebowiei]|uniref:Uncharacterized protein n=1 Tax=Schistosoma margrebowiei TaxID=48269 RepID=A0A183LS15_9TREM|nr:unnamed protein product [Schistosoma margrebowiei]
MFIIRRALKHRHAYRHLTMVLILDIRCELNDEKAKRRLQEQLRSHLGSSEDEADPDATWNDIQTAVETAAKYISNSNQRSRKTN